MKKRILAISLVVAMLAIAVIGGSLAYFTDADDAVNTFVVGNVDIELTEPSYHDNQTIMPGKTIAKDPTFTITADSQPAWVVLQMEVKYWVNFTHLMHEDAKAALSYTGDYDAFMAELKTSHTFREAVVDRWFQGINHADWKVMGGEAADPSEMVIDLGYTTVVAPGQSVKFMDSFTMPETITSEMINLYPISGEENFTIGFGVFAIQQEGIADIDAAYAALFK